MNKQTTVLNIPHDQRVSLKVRNLTVAVKAQQQQQKQKDTESVIDPNVGKILNDISFDLQSGQLMAIMGGSGSGKTTLLNTLSQRTNVKNKNLHFSGSVKYETEAKDTGHIQHAYLLQTDVFLPGLTVWETLSTQADLRLPPYVTTAEKHELIEYILDVLELTHLRDTWVSAFSSHASTLSGGEQRRVSLAIQLLSKPAILFLDEPTTGLDTSSSLKLIHVLKKLTMPEYGVTIILSIHQPRPEITELFDQICLLTRGGRLIYFGDLHHAESYFSNIDFLENATHQQQKNIIEYIMDLSVKDTSSVEKEQQTVARINRLVKMWNDNHTYREDDADGVKDQFRKNLKLFNKPKSDKISFMQELTVLTKRTFKLTYRDYKTLFVFDFGTIIYSITIGWMFYRPRHDIAGIRSLISVLYVALEVLGFVPMFIEVERLWSTDGVFFYREYQEHQTSILGFIISRRLGKLLLEDLPMSIFFSIITFFMWGLKLNGGAAFGIYFAIMFLIELCCMNAAMLTFAIAPNISISALWVNLLYQIQNSACGYFVNAATMPVYVRWTKYVAYFWYSFGALMNNQFHGWYGNCPYDDFTDPRCQEYRGDYQIELLGFPAGWLGAPIGYLSLWVIAFAVLSAIAFRIKSHDVGMAVVKKNKIGGEDDDDEKEEEEDKVIPSEEDYITDNQCLEINVNNIYLEVKQKNIFQQTKSTKTLLDGVTASFEANKVNVIMGPSGSGKTTLLNYLSNRLPRTSQFISQGLIRLNNTQEISRDQLARISAYVTQHDNALIATLTVRETLYFQARLRLPLDQHPHIPVIINKLIRQTGLTDCADTLIGSEYVKGISGGEKRRVSIAVQLLSRPKVLFLDEPTSGLDSSTAETILTLLDELAKENNTTVILTIHQPSEQMFYKFGSLLLLGRGGKVIYDGCSRGIVDYLSDLGYHNPEGHNIADYILDLVSKGMGEDKSQSEKRIDDLISHWKVNTLKKQGSSIVTYSEEIIDLPQYYYQRLPFFVTFPTIMKRQLISSYRHKDVVINRAGQTIFLAIIHTLYFAPLKNTQDGISNRLGLVQEVLNLYYAGLVNNITLYPTERDLFYQEYRDGIYGVTEFGVSYLINELPTEIIPSFFFAALIVFGVGLPRTAGMFFAMFGTGFISLNCGESLGIFVNSLFNHLGVATNILTTMVILSIFMGGTMSLYMPHFFKAINYINPMKYAVAICVNLGFEDQVFSCGEAGGECLLNTGEAVLEYYRLEANMGAMIGGLIGCFVVYRAIAIFSIYVRVKWF
ncbi:hypothetical protein SBY92_005267 [Candida maltosa Xu316]